MLKILGKGDILLLRLLNNTIKCKILDIIMPLMTYIGSIQFCVFYCTITLLFPNSNIRYLGIRVSSTLILTTSLVQLLKRKIIRTRPYDLLDNLHIRKIQIDRYSFPSGHTAAAFSIALQTAFILPHILFICLLLACLVGISRIYLGVHYPSDVTVAAFVATLSSILINLILM